VRISLVSAVTAAAIFAASTLNVPSAPRTITARVSSSSPIVFQTRASSPCIAPPTAFSRPGVRKVRRRT